MNDKEETKMDIELMGWISPEMTDDEILNMIDEIDKEEEAREELSDFAMNSRD